MEKKISLQEYKQELPESLRSRTLCFLVRDGKVLLGLKKRGVGQGYWLGIGGKVEEGESIHDALVRETIEEIGVKPVTVTQVAVLDFYFPYTAEPKKWNQKVYVFTASEWEGEPKESDEIKPQWFDSANIPINLMWADASYWLPEILRGNSLNMEFMFNKDLGVEEANKLDDDK